MSRKLEALKNVHIACVIDIDSTAINPETLTACPDVLQFYNSFRKLTYESGGCVHWVTARIGKSDSTWAQLKDAGFLKDDRETLCMYSPGGSVGSISQHELSKKISSYKFRCRNELRNKGWNVVLNVGDQWTDIFADPRY